MHKPGSKLPLLLIVFLVGSVFSSSFAAGNTEFSVTNNQAEISWPMAGANPQRTSWTPENLAGNLAAEWVRPIVPHIQQKVQVIAAENKIFVSTARGLYAFEAASGSQAWVFPTELPLANSPTYWNGVLYVGGFDRQIYAINASNGQRIWSYSARAGFSTNPVVVNQKVYLGDRDGNFYAVNALDGSLAWEFSAGGQILQSAAYQPEDDGLAATSHGIVVFPANDAHVYALDADTGSQAWKSPRLPGGGFFSWWPVIYRDFVILVTTRLGKNTDSDLLLGGAPQNAVPGVLGHEPGDWAPGETTLDLSTNPNGMTYADMLEQNPYYKRAIFLDRKTGQEAAIDIDADGLLDGAPVAWTGDAGSLTYPVVNGNDGVIYFRSITHARGASGGGIDGGGLIGWKISSPYVSLPYSDMSGQSLFLPSDEPLGLSSAGNKIYWNLTDDRFVGAVDLSVPNTSWPDFNFTRQWRYVNQGSDDYCLVQSLSLPLCYENEARKFWWHPPYPAVFWGENDKVGPVVYNGRLYNLMGNALVAFSPAGQGINAPVLPPAPSVPVTETSLPDDARLKERLEREVQQIILSGHLKPSWIDIGQLNSDLRTSYDDFTLQYWHNPADIQSVLLRALPYLTPSTQLQVRAYLQSEFAAFPPSRYAHTGWKAGAQRDPYLYPPVDSRYFAVDFDALPASAFAAWDLPPHNIYAVWKYAAAGLGDPLALYADSKGRLFAPISANNALLTDNYLAQFPHVHNAYIAGYWGYVELAKLAGQPLAEYQAYQTELERLLNLRKQNFTVFPYHDYSKPILDHYYSMITVWNFLYLTPELADYLMATIPAAVRQAVDTYSAIAPHWMLAHNGETQGENAMMPYQQTYTLFQARALALHQSKEELYKYLDSPVVPVGDLFYLDNLVAVLAARSMPPPPATVTPSPTNSATATSFPTYPPTPTGTNPPSATPTYTPTPATSPIPTATGTLSPSPTATGIPTTTPPGDLVFTDSFETGDFSGWSSVNDNGGDLSVGAAAALSGQLGMLVTVNDNYDVFVTDGSPEAETSYRARFYFDPNSIRMAKGNEHFLMYGLSEAGEPVLRVELNYTNGQYQVRAGVRDNASRWISTSYYIIADLGHYIELAWKAASNSKSRDGYLTIWIDGELKATLSNIDNGIRRIDAVILGAVAGVDNGTRGIYYFDAFKSTKNTYIGLE